MKMKVKSIMSLVVLIVVLVLSQNIFAEGPLAKYWQNYDGNAERASRQKVATEYGDNVLTSKQSNMQAAQQQLQDKAKSQVTDQLQSAMKSSGMLSNVTQAGQSNNKKTTSQPQCDCYDTSVPYNFPDNFEYNDKKERVQRINPPCICKAKADSIVSSASSSSVQGATMVQGTSSQQPIILTTSGASQSNSSTSKWRINYN